MGQDDRTRAPNLPEFDSGWVGADPEDDLEQRLAAETDSFDETRPHVLTALGPIEPEDLGVTLFAGGYQPLAGASREPVEVLLELEQAYAAGVRAVVDVTMARSARDLADVQWISSRSPVHIIVGGEPLDDWRSAMPAVVRSGITVRTSTSIEGAPSAATELPVFIRVTSPERIEEILTHPRAREQERTPWFVVDEAALGADREWDGALEQGFGFVLIVATDDLASMTRAATRMRELVGRGFGDRLALGYNADPSRFMERFPVLLMEAGLPAAAVRGVLVENPVRALTRARAG